MFGIFGGRFVAETLMPLILELEEEWTKAKADPAFRAELDHLNAHYTGRPSPMYFAERLTEHLGGAKIYFKRDELNHTGSHKINNCVGPDPACPAHGQDPDHRRNRRRPAWRGLGNRCGALRLPVRSLHGCHRRAAAGAERVPHEAARRQGAPGDIRPRHAEGRDERGASRLGDQCRRHLLPDRHGCRPASLSGNGAHLPVGHRPGSPRTDDCHAKAVCPTC
jgi:hypothetical protein